MIQVKNLVKHFGSKVAVDNVSFEVKKGEVLGFLGPNGAGKSTTMRMVTGFIPPTSGDVIVGGDSIVSQELAAQARIGYLPEAAPLYNDMTVRDFLKFAAEMRGMSGKDRGKAVDKAIETCFLQPVEFQSIETLSKGYRHRTCLAQSIIHDPEVLILDEPTDGLDPNQKHEVRSLIRRMGETKAIIFSTHILEEVEAACTRAIIIDQGTIIADGTPEDLKNRADGAGSISLRVSGTTDSLRGDLEKMKAVKSVKVLETAGDTLHLKVYPTTKKADHALSREVFQLCVEQKLVVEELAVQQGQLDELFRSLTASETLTATKKAA